MPLEGTAFRTDIAQGNGSNVLLPAFVPVDNNGNVVSGGGGGGGGGKL